MNAPQSTSLSFPETGKFSSLMEHYLNGHSDLDPFIGFPFERSALKEVAEKRGQFPVDRSLLQSTLQRQYEHLGVLPEAVQSNLTALGDDKTYTITTGHQLCLFTGPLYFVYKIASAIRMAKDAQEAMPGVRMVPVYWMATEDHDFAEVNHANVFGRKLVWEQEKGGAVGHLTTDTLNEVFSTLEEMLGSREGAADLLRQLQNAYHDTANLAEATRQLVHELFGRYGLLIIDADDAALKRSLIPVALDEFSSSTSFGLVQAQSEKLADLGYKTQVHPREINLFWMEDGVRERIVREGDRYQVLNTELSFSKEELENTLNEHPEKFSPNVVLRPLYQELILPNLAYIGGGGELAYWFQLKPVFDHFNAFYPMLVLRNSFMWVDLGAKKKLDKLDVSINDLFADSETLVKEYALKHALVDPTLDEQKQVLEEMMNAVAERAATIDASLRNAVQAEGQRMVKSLDGVEKRMVKAEKKRQETAVNQLTKLQQKLFPNQGLQERHDNFLPLYLRGGDEWIHALVQEADPFRKAFTILEEVAD